MAERFWAKVDKRGPDECWPWTAYRNPCGYGVMSDEGGRSGRNRPASQISWEIENGSPFPEGLYALHHCDNPACVNPAHIYAGTQLDNMRDQVRRRRHFRHAQTHCVRGHDLTDPDNLITQKLPARHCRACRRIISLRTYYRLKERGAAA